MILLKGRNALKSVSFVSANSNTVNVVGVESTVLKPSCQENSIPVQKVQLIPGLSVNLFSVNQIVRKGYPVVFSDSGCKVVHGSIDKVVRPDGSEINRRTQILYRILRWPFAVGVGIFPEEIGGGCLENLQRTTCSGRAAVRTED